ncbi:MAG: protein kinase, partial [Proteobacteria bacterium]|nr:protein kinase [Pseudomonadota bacterium]
MPARRSGLSSHRQAVGDCDRRPTRGRILSWPHHGTASSTIANQVDTRRQSRCHVGVFGPYRVDRVVGRGSSGRVLRVIDTRTDEPRALKLVFDARRPAMLFDEYAQLARLAHPSLPRVFEIGRIPAVLDLDGVTFPKHAPYFVASWITGVPIAARELGTTDPWLVLADVAGALATIHAAGLVHGDVAPQNILVDAARAVLVDLGLARATGARTVAEWIETPEQRALAT